MSKREQTRKKLQWLTILCKSSPDKQREAINCSKTHLVPDIVKLVKQINKAKGLKLTKRQKVLFQKHKGFLRRVVRAKGVKNKRRILLSRSRSTSTTLANTTGEGLILATVLPALISLFTGLFSK